MNLKGFRNEILMECKANLNMLIPKHFINIDSNSPPPTLCSCWLWNALATGGPAVMTGLWWINVELFISDWASPPPTHTACYPPPPPFFFFFFSRPRSPWLLEIPRTSSHRRSFNAVRLANMPSPSPTGLTLHSGISSALYLLLANYFLAVHSHNNWSCAAASPPSAAPSASLSTFPPLLCVVLIPLFFIVLQKPSN